MDVDDQKHYILQNIETSMDQLKQFTIEIIEQSYVVQDDQDKVIEDLRKRISDQELLVKSLSDEIDHLKAFLALD